MNLRAITYDYKLFRGDPMLLLSLAVPFILWALMQFLFPGIETLAMKNWDIAIGKWYRPAGILLMMVIPMMFGLVYGFILLDERDGGIITAISVTPLGKSGYLKLRLGIPLVLSFLFVFLYMKLLNLTGSIDLMRLILLSLVTASQALMLLLFLGAFADNKVVGMAIAKGFGILLIGPFLDLILPVPFCWIGGYSPLFWVSRALLTDGSASGWFYIAIALVFHGLLLLLLINKFVSRSD